MKRGRRGPARALTVAAALSYAANCALGALVATGRVDSSRRRWIHHVLYVSTFALTVAARGALGQNRNGAFWSLLPALLPLAVIPFAGTRLPRHGAIAVAAAPFYVASLTRPGS